MFNAYNDRDHDDGNNLLENIYGSFDEMPVGLISIYFESSTHAYVNYGTDRIGQTKEST